MLLFNAQNGNQRQFLNLQIPKTLPRNYINKAIFSCSEMSFLHRVGICQVNLNRICWIHKINKYIC